MKLKDAVRHFGTKYKVAKALGIHRSNLTRWHKGIVPMVRAAQLRDLSNGALRYDESEYTGR